MSKAALWSTSTEFSAKAWKWGKKAVNKLGSMACSVLQSPAAPIAAGAAAAAYGAPPHLTIDNADGAELNDFITFGRVQASSFSVEDHVGKLVEGHLAQLLPAAVVEEIKFVGDGAMFQ